MLLIGNAYATPIGGGWSYIPAVGDVARVNLGYLYVEYRDADINFATYGVTLPTLSNLTYFNAGYSRYADEKGFDYGLSFKLNEAFWIHGSMNTAIEGIKVGLTLCGDTRDWR